MKRPIHTPYRHRRGSSHPVNIPYSYHAYDKGGDDQDSEEDEELDFHSRRRSIDSERSSSLFMSRPTTPIASRHSLSSSLTSSPPLSTYAHPYPWMYPSSSTSALPTYIPPDPSSPFTAKFPPLHDEFDEREGEEEEETILGHQSGQPPRGSALFSGSNGRASLDDAYDSWTFVSADEPFDSSQQVPLSARKRWELFSVRLHLGVFHAKKRIAKRLPMKSSSSSSTSTATTPSSSVMMTTPTSSYPSSLPSSPR